MVEAAAYCRVSTDREDQASSFESQRRFFQQYIDSRPDWRLYQIYADEGVTGTSTKRREAFQRMLRDARQGRFQLLLTKEVSRFSRNILDAIAYTRELKALGVGVIFLNDGINTLDPDAELRLSIMGSLAQEESRRTSSRVKWGQARRMEQGVVFGRSLLGYDVRDGRLSVNPEGAELVRRIFRMYGVEKLGTTAIARTLEAEGVRTHSGNAKWSNSHLIKLLKNEKYAGDLVQKKTITPDYLSHAKRYNHGEEPLIVLRDHHPAIVDRALWELVQSELKRRSRGKGTGGSRRYPLSGKLTCGLCGAVLTPRRRGDGGVRRWGCRGGCGLGWSIGEAQALALLRRALAALELDREAVLQNVTALAAEARAGEDPEALERAAERVRQKRADALDAFFEKRITQEDLELLKGRYERELAALEERLAAARREGPCPPEAARRRLEAILKGEEDCEALGKNLLERITLYKGRRAEVRLRHLPHRWTYTLAGRGEEGPV